MIRAKMVFVGFLFGGGGVNHKFGYPRGLGLFTVRQHSLLCRALY